MQVKSSTSYPTSTFPIKYFYILKVACSLFLQLDKTIDIDERRLIRIAIRELRRCEIEEMEAALTSKRFRCAHQSRHENKENLCRYEEFVTLLFQSYYL